MKNYCRIACCFLFLCFFSPQHSTFTSWSQASSYPLFSQKCIDVEKTALLQLKRDLSAAIPESTDGVFPLDSLLPSWKPNTDCCSWEGVSCHEVTAHVIGLNISGYNFSDHVDSSNILNLRYLETLNLVNCSIEEIPSFLRNMVGLVKLDLSSNKISGQVPKWIWQLESLVHLSLSNNFFNGIEVPVPSPQLSSLTVLDLSSNLLEGSIPVLPPSIKFLSLGINRITGEIPVSFCNMSSLTMLDLCYNYVTGQIPQCLRDRSSTLTVLNLRENNFFGSILWNFTQECSLKTLNLYGNHLSGKIPISLSNCRSLEVLDLGDNWMNDTFPFWLGKLPHLRVLILQSNKFHGPIGQPSTSDDFPMLQILDLSANYFTGNLPSSYIAALKSMRMNSSASLSYLGSDYYREWMTITNKGQRMEGINIITIFTVLDLSNNLFEGEIPEVIGDLKLLEVLNLSSNNLKGGIPTSISKLTLLESLDLSRNELTGEIPMQLTSLTFLSVLNVSYNILAGKIPMGNQFSTFGDDSYQGNLGLCGFPLSNECGDVEKQQPSGTIQGSSPSDFGFPFSWKFTLVGYGCGVLVGAVIGLRNRRCNKWIEQSFKEKKGLKNVQKWRKRKLISCNRNHEEK